MKKFTKEDLLQVQRIMDKKAHQRLNIIPLEEMNIDNKDLGKEVEECLKNIRYEKQFTPVLLIWIVLSGLGVAIGLLSVLAVLYTIITLNKMIGILGWLLIYEVILYFITYLIHTVLDPESKHHYTKIKRRWHRRMKR